MGNSIKIDFTVIHMYKLSLVIPCYNEAKNLPALVQRIADSFNRADVEVVLVDNGSVDESPRVIAELLQSHQHIRSIRVEKNQGYGFGVISGLKVASGKYLGWTHADMQTNPADALRALEIIESVKTTEIVYVKGRRYGRPISDIIFTIGMSIFETLILGKCFWDINAQPNIFSRELFDKLTDLPSDFSLDLSVYCIKQKWLVPLLRDSQCILESAYMENHIGILIGNRK